MVHAFYYNYQTNGQLMDQFEDGLWATNVYFALFALQKDLSKYVDEKIAQLEDIVGINIYWWLPKCSMIYLWCHITQTSIPIDML